jgi:hypothetical protein
MARRRSEGNALGFISSYRENRVPAELRSSPRVLVACNEAGTHEDIQGEMTMHKLFTTVAAAALLAGISIAAAQTGGTSGGTSGGGGDSGASSGATTGAAGGSTGAGQSGTAGSTSGAAGGSDNDKLNPNVQRGQRATTPEGQRSK